MKISQVSLLMLIPIAIYGCSAPPSKSGSPTPVVTVTASAVPRLTPSSALTSNSLSHSPLASTRTTPSATPSAAPPASTSQVITVDDTGAKRTIDCNGQDVVITGNENNLTLHGKVGKLSVSGSTNQISVDNVTVVDISGVENRIQYDGPQPEIHNPGNENRVSALGVNPSPTPVSVSAP